jgi:LPS export ABC transporter protein LptC
MERRTAEAPVIPQEYMLNVKVTHFNPDGNVKDHIRAAYWAYLPEQACSKITEPRLQVIKPDSSVWNVEAKLAVAKHQRLDSKITELALSEEVVITRPEALNILPIEVVTTDVFYYPETSYVKTDKFVKMTKPGLHVTGVGLEGYLDKNLVELHNNVQTTYSKREAGGKRASGP